MSQDIPVTGYAILGLLTFGDELTGYEIKQRADVTLRFYWVSPAMSQIYTELRRLSRPRPRRGRRPHRRRARRDVVRHHRCRARPRCASGWTAPRPASPSSSTRSCSDCWSATRRSPTRPAGCCTTTSTSSTALARPRPRSASRCAGPTEPGEPVPVPVAGRGLGARLLRRRGAGTPAPSRAWPSLATRPARTGRDRRPLHRLARVTTRPSRSPARPRRPGAGRHPLGPARRRHRQGPLRRDLPDRDGVAAPGHQRPGPGRRRPADGCAGRTGRDWLVVLGFGAQPGHDELGDLPVLLPDPARHRGHHRVHRPAHAGGARAPGAPATSLWVVLAGVGRRRCSASSAPASTSLGVAYALLAGAAWAAYILLSASTGRRWAGFDGLAVASIVAAAAMTLPALLTRRCRRSGTAASCSSARWWAC